jgi:uncharacterized coiled-coil DUF342 family protein
MLEILLFVAIAVIGAQACIIALLVNLVNDTRKSKSAQVKQSRSFIRALIKAASETQAELEDYKQAYNDCYAEYKALFRENKTLKNQLEEINRIHGEVVSNLMTCIQEGRIIKTKQFGTVVPYELGRTTMDEMSRFFGTKIG